MEQEELPKHLSDLQDRLQNLEQEIAAIKARNTQVESNKAWETSRFRVTFLFVSTYLITALVFWMIEVEHFLQNALIPSIGYLLSTQSLPILKKWWCFHCNKQND